MICKIKPLTSHLFPHTESPYILAKGQHSDNHYNNALYNKKWPNFSFSNRQFVTVYFLTSAVNRKKMILMCGLCNNSELESVSFDTSLQPH